MKIHFIKHFIKHYLTATFVDVLHSPFVFNMYNNSIKKQKDTSKFIQIETQRKKLLQSIETIEYTDLGAGSNLLSTNISKKVSQIAKAHLKPARIAQIIHYLVLNYKHKNIIELGTSLGITSSYIASALKQNYTNSQVNFTTIEGVVDIKKLANIQFHNLGLNEYINSVEGNFNIQLPTVLSNYDSLDVLFIDGNHTLNATLDYFNQALPLAHNSSVFIFDDIYWSSQMTQAWEQIKAHPQVLQTVDLFYIGLVFFRTEQNKQHFKLRVI